MTIYFDEDFEGNLQTSGWGPFGTANIHVTTTQHVTGTRCLEMVYTDQTGLSGGGFLERAASWGPTDHMFCRYYFKTSVGFLCGTPNALTKHSNNLGGFNFSSSNSLETENPGAPPGPNGTFMWRTQSWDNLSERISTFTNVSDGQWHCIELEYKFNTPGQANGEIRIWVDAVDFTTPPKAQRTGRTLRGPTFGATPPGESPPFKIGSEAAFNYFTFYVQSGLGTIWIDRFAIGNERIGPLGVVIPPEPPVARPAIAGGGVGFIGQVISGGSR